MGGHSHNMLCTWQLSRLAIERPWLVLAGPFLTLLAQTTTPWDTVSGTVGHFRSGGAFADGRALTIECSLISGCGQGHEPQENGSKRIWLKFSVLVRC